MDSVTFNTKSFFKNNIVSSRPDLLSEVWEFYYYQIKEEIVKSLGGISSLISVQFLDDINTKVLQNIKIKHAGEVVEKLEVQELVIYFINKIGKISIQKYCFIRVRNFYVLL